MRFSNWTAEQFLDSNSLNALTSNVSGDFNAVGRAVSKPGIMYPELATFAASGLAINSTLPYPFGVCFGNGAIAHAHGTVTGLDTTTYTTSFSGVVPGSGPAVTAYLLASLTQILENSFTNTGPPQGHPDFNPNFVPSTAYETILDSLLLAVSTTPADNVLTFELGRTTLASGATGVVFSTVFQNRISGPNTSQVVQVSGNLLLNPSAHGGRTVQAIAPCSITLPAVSGSSDLIYSVANASTGTVTLQTQGSDLMFGLGSIPASGQTSFAVGAGTSIVLGGESGLYQAIGGSPPSAFPSGTGMVFAQASAPVGWTQATTFNDKVLRLVSGGTGGTSGGAWAISGLSTTVNGHVLTLAEIAAHSHNINISSGTESADHTHFVGTDLGPGAGATSQHIGTGGGATQAILSGSSFALTTEVESASHFHNVAGPTDSQGSNSAHTHSATSAGDGTWRPAYVDTIVATKN